MTDMTSFAAASSACVSHCRETGARAIRSVLRSADGTVIGLVYVTVDPAQAVEVLAAVERVEQLDPEAVTLPSGDGFLADDLAPSTPQPIY